LDIQGDVLARVHLGINTSDFSHDEHPLRIQFHSNGVFHRFSRSGNDPHVELFFDGIPSAGQKIGRLKFMGDNNNQTGAGYALIQGYAQSTIPGSETGSLSFNVNTGGQTPDWELSEAMRITSDLKVGIGTNAPTSKLDVNGGLKVRGSDLQIGTNDENATIIGTDVSGNLNLKPAVGGSAVFVRDGNTSRGIRIYGGEFNEIQSVDLDGNSPFTLDLNPSGGTVLLGRSSPANLEVRGTTHTRILTITGGSDLAEPFEVTGHDVRAGYVVSLDPQTPGRMCLATKAYDTKVAGIISGAGGVRPGMLMNQEGTFFGEHPVALTGKVYCWADATESPIEVGDLLTTSSTPGHAMKASDPGPRAGAVIGKAMSSLEEGKGLVLVLVSLQ